MCFDWFASLAGISSENHKNILESAVSWWSQAPLSNSRDRREQAASGFPIWWHPSCGGDILGGYQQHP